MTTTTRQCRGRERACPYRATRHEPDHTHERTILDLRRTPAVIQAITVDEDGEQQPLHYGPNATVHVALRTTPGRMEPAEETP